MSMHIVNSVACHILYFWHGSFVSKLIASGCNTGIGQLLVDGWMDIQIGVALINQGKSRPCIAFIKGLQIYFTKPIMWSWCTTPTVFDS